MMDWTDRHCRFFHRLLTSRALLFTEMITAQAILHGDRGRLLGFSAEERPLALQLGGSEPEAMARAAAWGEAFGYDEININAGCPSDRVQSGRFGACLMAEPETVAACVRAMRAATALPVTVKTRIGIDDQDSYAALAGFVATLAGAGIASLTVHARKAWLSGLSPKENREIPPLCYDVVHRLKHDFPGLEIVINGGFIDLDAAAAQLAHVDGVMIGRAAYQNPAMLAAVDHRFFDQEGPVPDRFAIVEQMMPYIARELAAGTALHAITRHMLGLFQGLPGARAWRRHLSEGAHKPGAGATLVREAAAIVAEAAEQALRRAA